MKALIIVDAQNDFCQGGSLEVAGSNAIFPYINELAQYGNFARIFCSKDWHPVNHSSFAVNQGKKPFEQIIDENGEKQVLWPVHCVQNSTGAELSPLLELNGRQAVDILKGTNMHEESYSAFGTSNNPTELTALIKSFNIKEVVVVGLALDFCVGNTAIDASKLGLNVTVIEEATRGVAENTCREMEAAMKAHGVKLISLKTYMEEGSMTDQSSEGEENF